MINQHVNQLTDGSTGLVLVSAWNDSGGGFLTRLLDGHLRLRGWPFELLLGTSGYRDNAASLIHDRYRWPLFDLSADRETWFDAISDNELKTVLAGNAPALFDAYRLDTSLAAWKAAFLAWPMPAKPERRDIIAGYIDSWFAIDGTKLAADRVLGHCPSLIVDAKAILADFPDAKLVHVVRDPVAGLGDFRRRHPQFAARDFAARWTLVNGAALEARARHPDAVMVVRYEKLRDDRERELKRVLDFLELPFEAATLTPTWRGAPLAEMGPFGGVAAASPSYDADMRGTVSDSDRDQLHVSTHGILRDADAAAAGR